MSLTDDAQAGGCFFGDELQPLLKAAMVSWEIPEDQRPRWQLKLGPADEEARTHFASNWQNTISRFRPAAKREGFLATIEPGIHTVGTLFRIESSHYLTCCGSSPYLLETVLGYFLVQFYSFC